MEINWIAYARATMQPLLFDNFTYIGVRTTNGQIEEIESNFIDAEVILFDEYTSFVVINSICEVLLERKYDSKIIYISH